MLFETNILEKAREEEERLLSLKAQKDDESAQLEKDRLMEEKSKAWRPSGRISASATIAPRVDDSNGQYVPPRDAAVSSPQISAGKYVPRREVVSSAAPPLATDSKVRGKYAPPREVAATTPYSAITKPKENSSSGESKPDGKWVPPHLRKK